jgi:hypothetical protein
VLFSNSKHGPGSPALTPEERRGGPRAPVNWRARIMVEPPRFVEVKVLDISEAGIGMTSEQRVPESGSFEMALAIPSPVDREKLQVVQVKIRIVSSLLTGGRFRIGAQFVRIDPAAKELVMFWIRTRADPTTL